MVSCSVFSDSWNRLHRYYCWSSEIGLEFICKSTSCCRFSDLKKEGIIPGSSNLQEASFRSSNHWRRRCVWSNKKCFIWRISIHHFGKAFVAPWVPQDLTLWFFRVACSQFSYQCCTKRGASPFKSLCVCCLFCSIRADFDAHCGMRPSQLRAFGK